MSDERFMRHYYGASGYVPPRRDGSSRLVWDKEKQEIQVQMKPTIGRIVIYNHPGSADGKYPPTQSPAIIQNVAADGTVRLFVFGPKGQHQDEGLTQGDGPCQWNWPPRV